MLLLNGKNFSGAYWGADDPRAPQGGLPRHRARSDRLWKVFEAPLLPVHRLDALGVPYRMVAVPIELVDALSVDAPPVRLKGST
jgi:hypothetical protein